ncbi:baeRF2 domain-containing protein [Actinomadura fibrosa]|uniref:Vms1/Ankzf1 family peptidyl-tRNA hydrolase n=1 Tax=Actinomadura fibrosa TaxID=111802 RepID=A0ABW2XLW8_9ACTN|nr:Vms1/Ankzf1 family peptidyl-tRNA hydrolase [Actinomadura fibrosa]
MDLSFLKPLYQRPGPYASVYVDLTRNTEDAAKAAELRWRALRADLQDQDVQDGTLQAIERTVDDELSRRRSEGLVIFAADGEVVLTEHLPGPPRASGAHVGPLPHVLPYLADRGERFPHLVAVVDRRGGAIDCVDGDGGHRRIDVDGDEEYPIRKVKAGDWSQSHFQRSAENAWRANAKKVADEIDRAAGSCGAEAVVIAGDTRARTAVLEGVSESVLEHTIEWDRNISVDDPDLEAELHRLLELKGAERVMAVAERFERELARGERAVAGPPATAEAARNAQIETLLLDDDPDSPARLWIGPEPTHVASSADELREAFGVTEPVQARADAALIRAVAGTDGDLVLLPPDSGLHVGAVLRFTT